MVLDMKELSIGTDAVIVVFLGNITLACMLLLQLFVHLTRDMAEIKKTFEQPRTTLHTVNGLLVPDFVKQENVDKLKDLELYPDDVWVVGYPKSGTTWTQQIVRLIRNNGVQDDVRISTAVPWPESSLYPVKMEDLELS